jgi:uncharacterized protein YegJ (DUF2314 family)
MFAITGKVYGAFTVHVLRSQMPPGERKAHDDAWGLDFGDSDTIELVYQGPKKKRF